MCVYIRLRNSHSTSVPVYVGLSECSSRRCHLKYLQKHIKELSPLKQELQNNCAHFNQFFFPKSSSSHLDKANDEIISVRWERSFRLWTSTFEMCLYVVEKLTLKTTYTRFGKAAWHISKSLNFTPEEQTEQTYAGRRVCVPAVLSISLLRLHQLL